MIICFMMSALLLFPFYMLLTDFAVMILYLIAVIASPVIFLILLIIGLLIKDKTTRTIEIILGALMLVYSLYIIVAGIIWSVFSIWPFIFIALVIIMPILSVWYTLILFKPSIFQREDYFN